MQGDRLCPAEERQGGCPDARPSAAHGAAARGLDRAQGGARPAGPAAAPGLARAGADLSQEPDPCGACRRRPQGGGGEALERRRPTVARWSERSGHASTVKRSLRAVSAVQKALSSRTKLTPRRSRLSNALASVVIDDLLV